LAENSHRQRLAPFFTGPTRALRRKKRDQFRKETPANDFLVTPNDPAPSNDDDDDDAGLSVSYLLSRRLRDNCEDLLCLVKMMDPGLAL
jgi:hypothetical protein